MKSPSILFSKCILVDPDAGVFGQRDILLSEGLIKALAPSLAPYEQWKTTGETLSLYDLQGIYLFPGLVDIHTHLRVPGGEHKETISTGTAAAAAGGFTTILAMPNTRPCIDSKSILKDLQRQLALEARIRVLPVAAITRDQKGSELVDMEVLQQEGAVAFSDDGMPVSDAEIMRQAMKETVRLGSRIISHCEDQRLAKGGIIQDGKTSRKLEVKGIPSVSEEVMVARDICLASDTGAHLHLAHLSTAGSVALVKAAKDKGISVTAEVTPHHLTLSVEAVLKFGANAKVNPPLRNDEDVTSLQRALKQGVFDAIASDHAPHHPEEKRLSLSEAPFGVVGLESTLPVVLSLVHQDIVDLNQAVRLLTSGPAQAMNISAGTLTPGKPADLVGVDLEHACTISARDFYSKARNCPFDGMPVKGAVLLTMVGGEVVFHNQKLFPQKRISVI